MFGKGWWDHPGPAFAHAGDYGPGGYEGWQPWARRETEAPPHDGGWGGHRHGPWGGPWGGPRGFGPGAWAWRFGRRPPFGPGMGPGPGGFGPRMFGRGDLKYALLDLLRERPKHGYEMIKDLEERSGGFYTPSAGAIYPTLQLLEDREWVTVETVEGKKVYAITDAGKAALAEHEQRMESSGAPWERGHHGHGPFGRHMRPELGKLRHSSIEVARLMRAAVLASGDDPERLKRLQAIVERTRNELNEFLGGHTEAGPEGAHGGSETPIEEV